MQHKAKKLTQQFTAYLTALVLVAGYPVSAMAETQEPTTPVAEVAQTAPLETAAPTVPVAEPQKPEPVYTFNEATGRWDSDNWRYNPATGVYERPPAPIVIEPPVETKATDETTKSVDTNVTAENNLNSNATSGNSTVAENTAGGSASTGDAAAIATMLNVVNSSVTTGNNQKVATFTQDIMGDVKGDIVLYPMLLKAMLEAQAGGDAGSTIDVKNNFQLDNNVDLTAKSGDANVNNNTSAGDATTGSATAVANVVNILNSMIATQESFIGTINIYGNLEGDILIAPDFIPQMIANNKDITSSNAQLSTKDSTDIVNNISAVAESGAAAVLANTVAGSATTGNADTGVVIFNLTGHEIVAKNSLLVFVNVLGKWVGVIVDAPAGATSALIGNGVTKNEAYAPDLKVNSESKHGITNTISVDAKSGDATVSGNTMAGGATTGSAVALANIANISGSQFGVSDWFGVLFINVFQNWYGDFGNDTPYGNTEEPSREVPTGPVQFIPTQEASNPPASQRAYSEPRVKINTQSLRTNNTATTLTTVTPTAAQPVADVMEVLGDAAAKDAEKVFDTGYDFRLFIVAGSLLAVGLSLLGLKRLFG